MDLKILCDMFQRKMFNLGVIKIAKSNLCFKYLILFQSVRCAKYYFLRFRWIKCLGVFKTYYDRHALGFTYFRIAFGNSNQFLNEVY